MKTNTLEKTKKLVTIALFCAVAYIGMYFRINVSFLTFDLKDAFMTVGAMFFGPIAGITMAAIVALLEFISISDTGIYGLIMNFLSSAVFASVAPLVYKYRRKLSGAVVGLLLSVICTVGIMIAANLFITPYYMGVDIEAVKGLIPTLLLPFNLTKSILNASLVLLLYKPVTTAMKAVKLIKTTQAPTTQTNRKVYSIAVVLVSLLLISACFVVFFVFMNGKI
ncbi:MAG: ECF transporter S component [Clostridia bacterium]|nr:ECF transporter S component [Clostridia bacterium]